MGIAEVTINQASNGYEVAGINGYDLYGALKAAIQEAMTDADVDAWHEGDITEHMRNILDDFNRLMPGAAVQVWGSRNGTEPLSITIA
jgi:hypothetical protein